MGKISSLFARKVLHELDTDINKAALLQSVGIEPGGALDPSQMIPDIEYYSVLERAATVDKNPTTIPLRASAAMRCDDYGAFGLAWKSATDLLGSYERAERYARVLTSVLAEHDTLRTFSGSYGVWIVRYLAVVQHCA
jgi:hypothetical protein